MTVSVSDTAQKELDAAAAYYHSISPQLAVRLLDESNNVLRFIDDYPTCIAERASTSESPRCGHSLLSYIIECG